MTPLEWIAQNWLQVCTFILLAILFIRDIRWGSRQKQYWKLISSHNLLKNLKAKAKEAKLAWKKIEEAEEREGEYKDEIARLSKSLKEALADAAVIIKEHSILNIGTSIVSRLDSIASSKDISEAMQDFKTTIDNVYWRIDEATKEHAKSTFASMNELIKYPESKEK